jgi:regulator of sigma E protease
MSLWLLAAIPVFAVIVLVHEFGHFITAKWADIRVEEFGIGFPPRAIGIKRGETIYSINWLPLGGFVRMTGENGELTAPQGDEGQRRQDGTANAAAQTSAASGSSAGAIDPRSFAAKPAAKRIIVLVAGVTMNLLLAIVLFAAADAVGQVQYRFHIDTVVSGSPAAQAGIRSGDTILSVNGQKVTYWSDFTGDVTNATQNAPAGASTVPVVLALEHKGAAEPVTLTVNARVHPPAGQGSLGVSGAFDKAVIVRTPLLQAPWAGVQEVGNTIGLIGATIHGIFSGTLSPAQALQGPVGIVQDSGLAASTIPQTGWYWILYLTGALSVSLAVANILPIPALDGGRVLLVLIEIARRGKRLSPEREGLINLAGFAVLISLMLIVTYFDISRIVTGR